MKTIKLHDKYFELFISEETIAKAVRKVAAEVMDDLDKDEVPVFIGILNGSFMFVADFVREYKYDCHLTFVKMASYEGTGTTGKVKHLIGVNEDLSGKTVVILEDIIDTGNTLEEIYRIFNEKDIKALKIATLFFKPDVFTKALHIDYVGLEIEDKFIVGYGLDYDGLGRNLKDVYQLKNL